MRRLVWLPVSAALLLPCYWQSRIQAGDLSSHIYNAWLAELIGRGQAPGLELAPQFTNVLFDLVLGALLGRWGAGAAQRIAVGAAVLIFVWGAFFLIAAVARRRPWALLPCLAMLSYGWVFHMGFFNFYLSLGLCFWAVALLWDLRRRSWAAVLPLALASVAHLLPVAWALGLLAYRRLAQRLRPRYRPVLLAAAVCLLLVLRYALVTCCPHRWPPGELFAFTGADQLRVYGPKYSAVAAGMLALWALLGLRLLRRQGPLRLALGVPSQLVALHVAGLALLPDSLLLPGYGHALAYVTERMSLPLAVLICAALAAARSRAAERAAVAALALVFFSFLYADARAVNRFEDRMEATVAQLPAGQRVVSALADPGSRVDPLAHVLDRVCVGRCYSYANYEASTLQFRVRARPGNPIVVARYADSYALQTGAYVLRESDLPLYRIDFCDDSGRRLCARPMRAGELFASRAFRVTPGLWRTRWPLG